MTIFYSPARGGFFLDGAGVPVPTDALEISAQLHAALLEAQTQGKVIQPGADGLPVALDPPPADPAVIMANLRARRTRLLRECDYTQMPDAPLSEAERAAWRTYRQALRDLPETTADPSAVQWPPAPTQDTPMQDAPHD